MLKSSKRKAQVMNPEYLRTQPEYSRTQGQHLAWWRAASWSSHERLDLCAFNKGILTCVLIKGSSADYFEYLLCASSLNRTGASRERYDSSWLVSFTLNLPENTQNTQRAQKKTPSTQKKAPKVPKSTESVLHHLVALQRLVTLCRAWWQLLAPGAFVLPGTTWVIKLFVPSGGT